MWSFLIYTNGVRPGIPIVDRVAGSLSGPEAGGRYLGAGGDGARVTGTDRRK